jgi:hypothetical protein
MRPGPSDECVSHERIQEIHHRFARDDGEAALNDLAERESSLAAFVICGGFYISHTAQRAGAPMSFVRWVNEEVITRALVCIEAQRQAHEEVWGDLLREACEPAQHGGDMADEQKPRVSALAMAKRSDDYATVAWTPEDVRRLRPAWSGPEARHFLEKYQTQLAAMILEAGWVKLMLLIEQYEAELRNEDRERQRDG